MKVSYRNAFCDRLAFAAYHLPRNPLFLLMTIGFFLFVTFESLVPALREPSANQPMIGRGIAFIFVESLLALILIAFWAVVTVLSMISRKDKPMFCEKTITLGDDGYVIESQYGKSETHWTMVQKLARTQRYIFIYLGQDNAVVIPRRAFDNCTHGDTFYDLCRQGTKRAG